MEHDEKPLPIDIRLLGALAEKVNSCVFLYDIYIYMFFYYVFSWGVGKMVISNSAVSDLMYSFRFLQI